jgi:phosphate starvation-inducible PhoH-like protein
MEDISNWERERTKRGTGKAITEKIDIRCKSEAQKRVIEAIDQKVISVVIGPPGTGKTYLSCAKALKFIKEEGETYHRIILIKSVNVPKDEEIGYLKGTLEEKMEMYMYPFISNFHKVIGKATTESLKSLGVIEILPIKFALGVTLDNAIIIVDEAQQISKDNLRTLITRIGMNSKMIFLGDVKQKSVNKKEKSALEILIEYFGEIPEIGCVQLGKEDIVRHPIIKKLEEIFDRIESSEKLNGK